MHNTTNINNAPKKDIDIISEPQKRADTSHQSPIPFTLFGENIPLKSKEEPPPKIDQDIFQIKMQEASEDTKKTDSKTSTILKIKKEEKPPAPEEEKTEKKTEILVIEILKKPTEEPKPLPPLKNVKVWGFFSGPLTWVATGVAKLLTVVLVAIFKDTTGKKQKSPAKLDDKKIDPKVDVKIDVKKEEKKPPPPLPQCFCRKYDPLIPKNLAELSRYPKTKAITVDQPHPTGIPNIGNSCYQNSAVQDIINLIETVGEEHFGIYTFLDKDRLTNYVNILLETSDFPEKHKQAISLLNNECSKKNALLIFHLTELAKSDLGKNRGEEPKVQDIHDRANLYLKALVAFEEMRKQQKAGENVKQETTTAFRQAMYDLHFHSYDPGLSNQRDSVEILYPLLDLLGGGIPNLYSLCTYTFNEDNFKIIEPKLPKNEVSDEISKSEQKEDLPILPIYSLQALKFKENCEKQPIDHKKIYKDQKLIEVEINPERVKLGSSLQCLAFEERIPDFDTFQVGHQFLDKRDELSLPLNFPSSRGDLSKYELKERLSIIEPKQKYCLDNSKPLPYSILYLNRGSQCYEHRTKEKKPIEVKINPEITIEVFDKQTHKVCGSVKQELIGASVHSGGVYGGHWYAYRKMGEKWFYCSDSTITEVDEVEQMFNQMSVLGSVFIYAQEKIKL